MKLIVQENVNNAIEIAKLTTVLEIADFDVGLRQLLEAQQSRTIIATDNITLEDSDTSIQFIDCNGANRIVNLPTASIDNHGFIIVNTTASVYTVTVMSGVETLGIIPPNGGIGWFLSNGTVWIKGGGGGSVGLDLEYLCQGRLTLESGVPVSTTDQTDKTNLYFTPYNGNLIEIYDGADWQRYQFTERTLAVGGFTASKPYDIFIHDEAGTLTLTGEVWTNATTRATALTTQDGVLVLTGATNKRYLGTIYIDAGQKCQDTEGARYVWNTYNRRPRPLFCTDTTDTWTYTTNAYRPFNNSSVNGIGRVSLVCGLSEDAVDLIVLATFSNSSVSIQGRAAIGVDVTNAVHEKCLNFGTESFVANDFVNVSAFLTTLLAPGFHFISTLEYSQAAGTMTWRGDGGSSDMRTGLRGTWLC